MELMIIEGAGKVAKITSFVNDKNIKVFATKGHIRELSDLNGGYGFYFEGPNAFKPNFQILGVGTTNSKNKTIKEMLALANEASKIYIATDPDREGEAIAWHIYELLENNQHKAIRITFNAINKNEILEAINNPRSIDNSLVNAAFCRQVYDRYLGYKLSKLVQNAIKLEKLSAGRVQSVALKMISDRENAIRNYKESYWWTYNPIVEISSTIAFKLNLTSLDISNDNEESDSTDTDDSFDKKFNSLEEINNFVNLLNINEYQLVNIETDDSSLSKPKKPLTTSELLSLASNTLKLNAKETTARLQFLYENGLISYPRTDSTRMSPEFCNEGFEYTLKTYGEDYSDNSFWFNKLKQKEGVQDGHECLRVAHLDIDNINKFVANGGKYEYFSLYELIWQRTCEVFLKPAIYKKTTVSFKNNNFIFTKTLKTLIFKGFKILYKINENNNDDVDIDYLNSCLNNTYKQINTINEAITKHKDSCPSRFDTGSLIKLLEQEGVGRPSTYATMAQINIEKHNVDVIKDKNKELMKLNDKGETLNKLIQKIAPNLINEKFTSNFEKDLDLIADSKENWLDVIKRYTKEVNQIIDTFSSENLQEFNMKKETICGICPKCGANLYLRNSKNNKEYKVCCNRVYDPNTKTTSGCDYLEWINNDKVVGLCPKCGGNLIEKLSQNNKKYKVCSNRKYDPNTKTSFGCDYIEWITKTSNSYKKFK